MSPSSSSSSYPIAPPVHGWLLRSLPAPRRLLRGVSREKSLARSLARSLSRGVSREESKESLVRSEWLASPSSLSSPVAIVVVVAIIVTRRHRRRLVGCCVLLMERQCGVSGVQVWCERVVWCERGVVLAWCERGVVRASGESLARRVGYICTYHTIVHIVLRNP